MEVNSIILGKFRETGINKIDVKKVYSKWNHLWFISQWEEKFRLIKGIRKDSPLCNIKLTISKKQAMEIINYLKLERIPSSIFRNACSWRREKEIK